MRFPAPKSKNNSFLTMKIQNEKGSNCTFCIDMRLPCES